MKKQVLAFDLGASSGRGILGEYDGRTIQISEIIRFANEPVEVNGRIYWDILRLYHNIKNGIGRAAIQSGQRIESIGIDSWGVDFGLLDKKGALLQNPVHYRDSRTENIQERVNSRLSKEYIYEKTGIQFLNFNTVNQLFYLVENEPELLELAETMLFIPDLLNYFLTGERYTEYTIASTGQLLSAGDRDWCHDIIDGLNIPRGIFTQICNPGTKIGELLPEIRQEANLNNISVYTVASHDTASAIAALPVKKEENYAYLSCGTWSLLGIELEQPLINSDSFNCNFTNEGGYDRKIRFLKNIMGLWLIQESRRQWQREGTDLSYDELNSLCHKSKPFERFIDPDNNSFLAPGNMPERIADYCRKTNQSIPQTKGDIVRCITESLALKYRYSIDKLEEIRGEAIDCLHIIGGGVQNSLLCQYTANATGKRVTAGPVEATAVGNIAVQLISAGEFDNLEQAREAISESFPIKIYQPEETDKWAEAYEKFKKIIENR